MPSFRAWRAAVWIENRACVPKRKRELCACSDNLQVSVCFPRRHGCTRRSRTCVHAKRGTQGSSFVSTKSVIESDDGKNVLVFVWSASMRVVSSASLDACRTPRLIRQIGQHVLFSVGADRWYRRWTRTRGPPSRSPWVCHFRCLGTCRQR